MKKCKISFRYECEDTINPEEEKLILENLDEIDLEQKIKDLLDEYLQGQGTTEDDSRILDYKLEFVEDKK